MVKELRARVQAAQAKLRGRQRRIAWWFTVACLAFVAGIVCPSTTVAAALLGVAACGFLAAAASVRGRNEASDELARLRLDAERAA
jgi:hypothetical protein